MGDWHVGDPVGFGNDIGAPEVPYMSYVKRKGNEEETPIPKKDSLQHRAKMIGKEALRLEKEERYDEALVFIDRALELKGDDVYNLNIKAIILDNSGHHEEALEFYDRSLKVLNSDVVKANKAQCLYRIAKKEYINRNYDYALGCINKALAILPDDDGRDDYLCLKGDILSALGRHEQAEKCYLTSEGKHSEANKIERHSHDSAKPLICIVGAKHYKGLEPFKRGLVVELFEEAGNDFDPDAVRVEITGETVGYVANSPETLVDGVRSASQIKRLFKNRIEAEVLSIQDNEYVIARLLGV